MAKFTQYSEDGNKWSFGGAEKFKWVRTITVETVDGEKVRTVGEPEKIKPTKQDPACYGCEKE